MWRLKEPGGTRVVLISGLSPDGFAHAHSHYIAEHVQIENHDGKLAVAAHGDGRSVQHLEGFRQYVVIADFRKQIASS